MPAEAKINAERREILFTGIPRIIPPRDMRANLHRLLDEALDAFRGGTEPAPLAEGEGA